MGALVALAASLAWTSPAAADGARASIVGGDAASIAAYPWLAFIEAETGPEEGFQCTGTVVAPRVVLTAGHCVEDIDSGRLTPAADFAVATGVADLSTVRATDVSRVSQAVVNPSFRPSLLHNDAGLLVLATPTSAPALPLATAADAALLEPGSPLSVAGWGLTDGKAKGIDGLLRAADTVVQAAGFCRSGVGEYYPFYAPTTQLCAADPPAFASGTCHGDSGGPAIARQGGAPIQVGIISLGQAGCSTKLPDVFTRVDRVQPWVAGWIAAVEAGDAAPSVTVPKATLPAMTRSRAAYFVARGLREDFGSRYRAGSRKTARCARLNPARVRCGVTWTDAGEDYFGTITVFYVLGREAVLWNDRYSIHWVADRCLAYGGDLESCPVHTKRR